MKLIKSILLAVLLLGSATASVAWAHGHVRTRVGVYINPWPLAYSDPFYYPYSYAYAYPYGYPYRYYSETVVVPSAPTTYIEQSAADNAAPQASSTTTDWYYCHNPDGYYPYVKSCPGGWQKVPSHPPLQH